MAAAELGIDPADRPLVTVADECMAALAAKTTSNHILALIAGMGTFWLIGAII